MNDRIIATLAVATLVAALVAFAPRQGKRQAVLAVTAPEAPNIVEASAPASAAVAPTDSPAPIAKPAAPVAAPVAAPIAAPTAAVAVPAQQAAGARGVWGVIESIDLKTLAVSVKDRRGRLHELKLAADAKVTKGGEDIPQALTDLKPGDSVTVSAVGETAQLIHIRISLTAAN